VRADTSRAHRLTYLLCAVAAAMLAGAWAGATAPAAAAAPSGAQIDAYLGAHGSPMVGSGATFVTDGQEYGVDPAFLVAIAGAETNFGQFLYSRDGDQSEFNAFNWFYGPTWPKSDFSSWDEAIDRVAAGLAGPLYYGAGLYSVETIAPRYCPDGTDNWITNVSAFLAELGGDPADTRVAVVLPPAPSVQPGLVALDGSVVVEGRRHEVGSHVDIHFTIANRGQQPLTLDAIRLAVRGPAGASADMVSRASVTLAAGEVRVITAAVPIDVPGRWHGWIEVQQNGVPSLVGEERAFQFVVRLPRDPLVRRWFLRDQALGA
jgi:hypothetical protein